VIRRFVGLLAILMSMSCATRNPTCGGVPVAVPAFEHLDECPNPTLESMGWRLIQGSVIEVTGPRTFRLRTDTGEIVRVSLANVGEPVDPEAVTFLQRLISHKRVSVMANPSADPRREITAEVQDNEGRDLGHEMLLAGAAAFISAPAYTLSGYSECVNRIAEREAKAEGRGIWHHQ